VTDVVGRLRRLGTQRIAVVPYFLSPGFLAGRVVAAAEAAGADVVTDVLGPHPAIASLVVDRYREALAGDIRMNCDTCLYRSPLRGRVAEVGAPLVPRREVVG
jgi:sirohydrochlorin cobaltochelatase